MEWYHYVIIGAGAIILLMLIIALLGGRKTSNKDIAPTKSAMPAQTIEKPKTMEKASAAPQPKPQVAQKPVVKDLPKVAKQPPKPTAPVSEAEDSDKTAKYHVSQNKDAKSQSYKKWRVRKEGSNKTIKFFDTQKEAIDYAEDLAKSAGSSVVIHKLDGSIRKQDYAKKA